ncbi:MAG: hypothetical protein K2J93_07420 [Anaeroplasmataceae bacterium]|nr:hypothetical protein [Anaeroplasmataceae bacterium]
MEEKEEGISLGEIFHVLFIKKWLLLIVTLVVMLVGVVFVQFVYNPRKVEYQATFKVIFPDAYKVEEDSTRHYPDGTEFLYQELISLQNLKKAQAKDESFSTINVEKMKRRNGVTIQEYEQIINNAPVKLEIYSIFIKKSYFSSAEQARDFFEALIDVPVETVLEKSKLIDYDRYLKQFNLVDDYESQLDLLISQKNLIISNYDNLITKYSTAHSITLSDGTRKSISEAQSDVESYFTRYDLSAMKSEVVKNGYLQPDSELLNTIQNRKLELERELEENELKLEYFTEQFQKLSQGGGQTLILQDLVSAISKHTERIAEIKYTIENVYDVFLNNSKDPDYAKNLAAFETRVNNHYEKLKEFTEIYTAFNNEIYETNTKTIVSAGSVITQDGGFSIIIAIPAFLVIGFVLGCILNLCLDLPKYLKEKKNPKAKEEVEGNQEAIE